MATEEEIQLESGLEVSDYVVFDPKNLESFNERISFSDENIDEILNRISSFEDEEVSLTIGGESAPESEERFQLKIAKEIFADRKIFFYSYGGSLPVDLTKKILSPWSVTVVGIQLAIYCKIPKIILLGVNHDWQCIKKYTHFYFLLA